MFITLFVVLPCDLFVLSRVILKSNLIPAEKTNARTGAAMKDSSIIWSGPFPETISHASSAPRTAYTADALIENIFNTVRLMSEESSTIIRDMQSIRE